MKRFTLLFTPTCSLQLLEEQRQKFISHNDCENCEENTTCPIKNNQPSAQAFMVTQTNDFDQLQKIIQLLYTSHSIEIILLIDEQKDFVYIYKAKGSLARIKTEILPPIINRYEKTIAHEDVFFTVHDVRINLLFQDISKN